jgi:hypothetical protein
MEKRTLLDSRSLPADRPREHKLPIVPGQAALVDQVFYADAASVFADAGQVHWVHGFTKKIRPGPAPSVWSDHRRCWLKHRDAADFHRRAACQYLQPHLRHAQVKQQDVRCFCGGSSHSTLGFVSTNETAVASSRNAWVISIFRTSSIIMMIESIASKADWGETSRQLQRFSRSPTGQFC